MESALPDNAATGASAISTTSEHALGTSVPATASENDGVAAANEPDLWGALSPVGGTSYSTAHNGAFGDSVMEPVVHVTQAPSPNPFDAFDVFAAPLPPPQSSSSSLTSSSFSGHNRTDQETLVLPPPVHIATGNPVAFGSPLISFSPVASVAPPSSSSSSSSVPSAFPFDATASMSDNTTAYAVDDLLSFSPVAAQPPTSSSSSSLMMMDDFFLGSNIDTSISPVQEAPLATDPSTNSSLHTFSPLASPVSSAPVVSDPSESMRSSVGDLDTPPAIDQDASGDTSSSPQEIATEDEADHTAVCLSVQHEVTDAPPLGEKGDDNVQLKSAVSEDGLSSSLHDDLNSSLQDDASSSLEGMIPRSEEEVQEPGSILLQHGAEGTQTDQQEAENENDDQETAAAAVSDNSEPVDQVEFTAVDRTSESPAAYAAEDLVQSPSVTQQSAWNPHVVQATDDHGDESEAGAEGVVSRDTTVTTRDELPQQAEDGAAQARTSPSEAVVAATESSLDQELESPAATGQLEGSRTSSGSEDDGHGYYLSTEIDVVVSQFDAEATQLYANVENDEAETEADTIGNRDHHDHHPVLDVSVAPLQLPLPESDFRQAEAEFASPSSVVSSPGSSVAGSAFAFISTDASSSFSFGQSVPSPSEVVASRSSDSESDDQDTLSPVAAILDHKADAVAHEEVGEDFNWTTTHASDEFSESVPTQDDSDADFNGFCDAVKINGDLQEDQLEVSIADEKKPSLHVQYSHQVPPHEEDDDDFGGFNDGAETSFEIEASSSEFSTIAETKSSFGFESFGQAAQVDIFDGGNDDDDDDDDDGFGGFAQSSTGATGSTENDDDDDFGDFGTATGWGSSATETTVNTTTTNDADDDDDGFGDFTPASASQQWGEDVTSVASTAAPPVVSSAWSSSASHASQPAEVVAAPTDLDAFFGSAFPIAKAPVAMSLLPKPTPSHGAAMPSMAASAIFDQANGGALHKSFHASLQEFRAMLTAEHDGPGYGHAQQHQHQHQPPFESEALRLKYLKYVLSEKLNAASRPDGVFPHGSEKYHLFASIAESSHEKNMREALAQVQEGLFQGSVNEAVMRIAKQAALSAKARIAEQAAQQQAHARGSILATTRHFLSRSAGAAGATSSTQAAHGSGPGSADKDPSAQGSSRTASGGSLGSLTPTGASVQKLSRYLFQNGHESEPGNSSGYGSGEDTGSDVSVGEASGHSEGDLTGTPGGGGGSGSGPPSGSAGSRSGGGGLMKKFHERLTSLSSTKQRSRTVSLRRMGQSSEDVCKMELHMESINGGFDEVKWRCAMFLYESDEVAHLAPSQIKILAYPSNQLLTGKSDRSALSKFFKPGTIWSIDIGASSTAGVSME